MRQKKPWEAIGISRASWYRHGKPSKKPTRVTVADEARRAGVSKRTYQRLKRVMMADMDLAALMLKHGWCKPGQAERLLTNPHAHRAFRKMIKAWKSKQRRERRR